MTHYDLQLHFPPSLCRLLARSEPRSHLGRGCAPRDNASISALSGLLLPTVEALSQQHTWEHVSCEWERRFTLGCGVRFDSSRDMRRHVDYLRKNPDFEYLRRSELWLPYYGPLMLAWAKEAQKNLPRMTCRPVIAMVERLTRK